MYGKNEDIYIKTLNENSLSNKDILSLKKKTERHEKQSERQKVDDKKRKSFYEDEIVILDKEFTNNKGVSGNEYNISIKKEILSKENDICTRAYGWTSLTLFP